MNRKTCYITTPIFYANSTPHIGSTYTMIIAEVLKQYKMFKNIETRYITGTDEHGEKILETAKSKGVEPQKFVDDLSVRFKEIWKELYFTYDYFVRTTDKDHEKSVLYFVNKLLEKGDIYKGKYESWYCVPCETYFTQSQLIDNKCPECKRDVKWIEEENYFFKMSKYQDSLIKHFEENPDFIYPEFRKKEILKRLEEPLKDLSISRSSFDWGIKMPHDDKHIIYVWFDALISYLTSIGFLKDMDTFNRFWPNSIHLMAKEILWHHSVIWPCMLMALDMPLPKQLAIHGWLTVDGDKISKSSQNAIDPVVLADKYSLDVIKYFLLAEMTFGQDGDFSEKRVIERYNFDLANDLGNLLNRTIAMSKQNFDGNIINRNVIEEVDNELFNNFDNMLKEFDFYFEKYEFSKALDKLWNFIRSLNKYYDVTEPWFLKKDETKKTRLETVFYNALECLKNIVILLKPIMPIKSREMAKQLNIEEFYNNSFFDDIKIKKDSEFSLNDNTPIFPRIKMEDYIEVKKEEKKKEKNKKKKDENIGVITIDDFKKCLMKVGEIKEIEDIENSDKLYKLKVDVNEDNLRQIIAGIKPYYEKEKLLNKKVIVLCNIKEAEIFGLKSQGMLLASKHKKIMRLLVPDDEIVLGAIIS